MSDGRWQISGRPGLLLAGRDDQPVAPIDLGPGHVDMPVCMCLSAWIPNLGSWTVRCAEIMLSCTKIAHMPNAVASRSQ